MRFPSTARTTLAGALALTLVVGLAACGDDDGGGVREVGDESSGSASGSASASASASGSASASASASAAEAACVEVGDPSAADTTVDVTLAEFDITPSSPSAPAGSVAFSATNDGEEPHEIVVAQTDLAPGDLPVDADGAVDEAALPAGAVLGEIEGFPAGETCEGAFDLEPGAYVLFCNIVETEADGAVEAHYAEGMYAAFTVE